MHITFQNIMSEKTIYLPYPIQNLDSSKEIAMVSFFQDNIIQKSVNIGKTVKPKIDIESEKSLETSKDVLAFRNLRKPFKDERGFDMPEIEKTYKLIHVNSINFILNELDNTENLVNERFSNILFNYHVQKYKKSTFYESKNRQYKKLKNGVFTSLTIQMTDQNNQPVSLGTQVVLHIR